MVRALVLVLLTLPLIAEPSWRERKLEEAMPPRRAVRSQAQDAPKAIAVDCTKGESVQSAVDKNTSPVAIEIHGICHENVVVYQKDVTLRGADPLNDGIEGVATNTPALLLRHVGTASIENLSLSNTSGNGLRVIDSHVAMTNCRVVGNTAGGMVAADNAHVQALSSTFSQNLRGAVVSNASSFFCEGCTFSNNVRFAAVSARHSVVSLLNSVVTGSQGIQATLGAYIDVDCVSSAVVHPCSLNATQIASQAFGNGAVAGMYAAGDFTGNVNADDHAQAFLYGSRQLATPATNSVDTFGTLWVIPAFETGQQSQLFGTTNASGFARVLLRDQSTLAGTIQCDSAADAWLDPTVITTPGASVTGCEHASVP